MVIGDWIVLCNVDLTHSLLVFKIKAGDLEMERQRPTWKTKTSQDVKKAFQVIF